MFLLIGEGAKGVFYVLVRRLCPSLLLLDWDSQVDKCSEESLMLEAELWEGAGGAILHKKNILFLFYLKPSPSYFILRHVPFRLFRSLNLQSYVL